MIDGRLIAAIHVDDDPKNLKPSSYVNLLPNFVCLIRASTELSLLSVHISMGKSFVNCPTKDRTNLKHKREIKETFYESFIGNILFILLVWLSRYLYTQSTIESMKAPTLELRSHVRQRFFIARRLGPRVSFLFLDSFFFVQTYSTSLLLHNGIRNDTIGNLEAKRKASKKLRWKIIEKENKIKLNCTAGEERRKRYESLAPFHKLRDRGTAIDSDSCNGQLHLARNSELAGNKLRDGRR